MKLNDIFDLILSIVLIVCLILFGISVIKEIIIMNELEYPEECVKINEDYYCRVANNIKDKSVRM